MSIFRENEQLYSKLADFYQCLAGTERFQQAHSCINQFLSLDAARNHYEQLLELEEELHQKQHEGNITEKDLAKYRELNERLQQYPLAEEFFNAQQDLEEIHLEIANFIGMAIENGEVPTHDELEEACGSDCDCGCH